MKLNHKYVVLVTSTGILVITSVGVFIFRNYIDVQKTQYLALTFSAFAHHYL